MKFRSTIERIVDGDTVVASIHLPLNVTLRGQYIRLYGVNAPEIRGETLEVGEDASEWLYRQIEAEKFIVKIDIRGKGKYGRWLGILYNSQGESLNELLVDAGHAEQCATEMDYSVGAGGEVFHLTRVS